MTAPAHSPEPWRELVIRPRTGWIAVEWRELWDARELLWFLTLRDIKVRYKQTVLGVLWAVLQPLLTMAVFTIIFGRFAKIPSDGLPYALFVFAGLLPWTFFSNSVNQASMSLINQQSLLTKIYMPRLFIPASALGSGLLDLAVSFLVFGLLALYYGSPIGLGALALPILILLTAAASLGIGLTLAAVIVTYRDFRYVVPFLIQLWMYVSPIIYPVSIVPERWQPLLALNPMAGLIDGFRSALFGRPWNLTALLISSCSTVVLLVYGLFYFRKTERRFADVA
ncbi:MAG: ABC transporter permease [Acidobacteriales bacterium]|nr:ABC transporter permease [Terriglobales bacterium]